MEMEIVEDAAVIETAAEIMTRPQTHLTETELLLKMGVERNIDGANLEILIRLKNQEKAQFNKEQFEIDFSKMKSELPVIEKTAEARDANEKVMYKFAPLEDIQQACDPIISKYRFAYHWEESYIPETKSKRVTFFLTNHNHTQTNYFDVPDIEGNKMINPIQIAGIKSSYGKRYTFTAGLGVVLKGEDDDATSFTIDEMKKYAPEIVAFDECETEAQLRKYWGYVWKDEKYTLDDRRSLGVLKDIRKEEIKKESATTKKEVKK